MPVPLSRRELLAALGLPAVMIAGCGDDARLPPEGEIVGAKHELAHRIRDGFRPQPACDAWRDVDLVIVGGGVAGLSAAWRLRRAGFDDFVVLELEQAPGGTSRSGRSELVAYPWAAHYIPAPMKENRALVRLLDEMGIVEGRDEHGEPRIGEQFLCRDPQERLHFQGKWHAGLFPYEDAEPRDLADLERFEGHVDAWADWRDGDGRRAFTLPLAACSDDPRVTALDRISMSDWLRRQGLDSPRLRWLVDYSCRDDYGATADQTSAWAGLFYFAARVRAAGCDPQPLITWPEGNGRLVEHLLQSAGDRVRLGRAVTEIVPPPLEPQRLVEGAAADRDRINVVAVAREETAPEGYRARFVIFAVPQFLAPHLIRDLPEHRRRLAREFEYGSWVTANLHLSHRPAENGFSPAWDNVLYGSDSLGYVTATHQRGMDFGPTVLTWYYPLCDSAPDAARRRMLTLEWADWAEIALSDLETAHADIRELCTRLDVMLWGHAMVRPRPGFVWSEARREASAPLGGIHFAHTDLSGVALFEEAFFHGLRAAEEVLSASGRDVPTLL